MATASLICKRKPLDFHKVDDEVLVYDDAQGATHRLNQTAYVIWRSCNGRRSADAISTRVSRVWHIDKKRADCDVADALRQMLRNKLLERVR